MTRATTNKHEIWVNIDIKMKEKEERRAKFIFEVSCKSIVAKISIFDLLMKLSESCLLVFSKSCTLKEIRMFRN